MQDIDFLPSEYKQSHTRRQRQSWHVIVIAISIGLIACGTIHQIYRRASLNRQLEATAPHHQTATAQAARLATMQTEYKKTTADAELITYLRHIWPRTQILSALIELLPNDITLKSVEITQERPKSAGPAKYIPVAQRALQQKAMADQPPATRALKRFRSELDSLQTIVTISGVTSDSVALHNYLSSLGQSKMFAKTELRSFEIDARDKTGSLQFSAIAIVKPGYGQPNGPIKTDSTETPDNQQVSARSDKSS